MKKKIITGLLFLSLLVIGCDSTETYVSTTSEEPANNEIITNQDSFKVLVNQKAVVTIKELPEIAKDKTVEWSVIEGSEYFKVFEDGIILGLKSGSGTLQVKVKGTNIKKEMPVTVIDQQDDAFMAFPLANNSFRSDNIFNLCTTPSTGKQKILVIPVHVYGCDDNMKENDIALIRKAYNSTNREDGWSSIREYYLNASYGAYEVEAVVPDQWFDLPSEYTIDYLSTSSFTINTIPKLALEWYKNTYPDVDLSEFDNNGDNIIDNFQLVHNSDVTTGGLWAWTSAAYYDEEPEGMKVDSFVSYGITMLKDSFYSTSNDGVGTKPIIHENGHMLGLVDYYDNYQTHMDVSGTLDMQSTGYFDWNSFSKYSTGWGATRYVNSSYLKEHKSAKITLSNYALSGECLLIKNDSWNGMPFDEYILIELFNADAGNNYYDSLSDVAKDLGPITYGIKIYHVDARVIQVFDDGIEGSNIEILDGDNINKPGKCQRFYMNNNNSTEARKQDNPLAKQLDEDYYHYYLLHLLQKGNENTFAVENKKTRNAFNDTDLWQTGDTFTIGEHQGYVDYGQNFFYKKDKFNDNSTFPYGIVFDEVTANTASLTINYLG